MRIVFLGFLFLLSGIPCNAQEIIGVWRFVELYDGEVCYQLENDSPMTFSLGDTAWHKVQANDSAKGLCFIFSMIHEFCDDGKMYITIPFYGTWEQDYATDVANDMIWIKTDQYKYKPSRFLYRNGMLVLINDDLDYTGGIGRLVFGEVVYERVLEPGLH